MSQEKFIPSSKLNTAVLFLVFNRLDTTKEVFEKIKKAKPPKLYIASDGPRHDEESKKVNIVRKYILENIDWECEVTTLFREKNLGCKIAVSSAIDWFFNNEEQGIILEDDVVPSLNFFWYCEELLNRYKDDLRIGQVSGFNYNYKNDNIKYDYLFSKYPMIWGWATWKNRWKSYTLELESFEDIVKMNQFKTIFTQKELEKRLDILNKIKNNEIDTWDYQWAYNLYKNSQFTIIPKKNLIINLGFNEEATHTTGKNPYEDLSLDEFTSELSHPNYIIQDPKLYDIIYKETSFFDDFKNKIKSIIKGILFYGK